MSKLHCIRKHAFAGRSKRRKHALKTCAHYHRQRFSFFKLHNTVNVCETGVPQHVHNQCSPGSNKQFSTGHVLISNCTQLQHRDPPMNHRIMLKLSPSLLFIICHLVHNIATTKSQTVLNSRLSVVMGKGMAPDHRMPQ
jgi:hypothetical protein